MRSKISGSATRMGTAEHGSYLSQHSGHHASKGITKCHGFQSMTVRIHIQSSAKQALLRLDFGPYLDRFA